jgi:hypothetical protein
MKYERRRGTVTAEQWGPDKQVEGVKQTAPERGTLTPRAILRTQHGTFFVQDGDWIVTDGFGNKWVVEFGRFPELYQPYREPEGNDPGDDPDYVGA